MHIHRIYPLLARGLIRFASRRRPAYYDYSGCENVDNRSRLEQPECDIRRSIAPGLTVEILGINGTISAEVASGDELQVIATKHSTIGDPADVVIEVLDHRDGITVLGAYADNDLSSRGKRRRADMPGGNNDVQVDFKVFIPSSVRLVARLLNGQINTSLLQSDISAEVLNGELNVSTFRAVKAVAVNGAITVSIGEHSLANPIVCRTTNGCITLDLPSQSDADVEARTLNGNISTDFPLTVMGRFNSREVNGVIGRGGRKLILETSNGSIELRRRS